MKKPIAYILRWIAFEINFFSCLLEAIADDLDKMADKLHKREKLIL